MTEEESAWLDKLLCLDVETRDRELRQLATSNPLLHARLTRLLAAAAADSHALMGPVVEGIEAYVHSALARHAPGELLAGYRLLREIGRGGMSVVWLAERNDGFIKRTVALKLPLYVLKSPHEFGRFAREKDVLASLAHPHIARLYDAGIADSGQPLLVLEFVDGVPITTYCDQHRLGIHERLKLFLQVLAAVGDAHRHLVVHRDLKPSNILVDAQGQVKLLDFGIAKLLQEPRAPRSAEPAEARAPRANIGERVTELAMTTLYAAPEQLNGAAVSTVTDVYALGVLLYELLAGALPYVGIEKATPETDVVSAISLGRVAELCEIPLRDSTARDRALPTAHKLRSRLAGDLSAIARKAIHVDPVQRYSSTERFADDLERFLASKPISARPRSMLYTATRFFQRHRGASIAASIGLVLTLAAAAAALQQYNGALAKEARAVALLDFMLDLVDDAEQDETQAAADITGKQMIDRAVARAADRFAGQPALQGQLLGELGNMQRRLGEVDAGKRTTANALRLLEATVAPDDTRLNRVRANLSSMLLVEGEFAAARTLAAQVRSACSERSVACAQSRFAANTILGAVYQMEGRTEDAIATLRGAVEDAAIADGRQSTALLSALTTLAIAQRNAGLFTEARQSIGQALSMSATQKLKKTERMLISSTAALLDLDLGHYSLAREQFERLLPEVSAANDLTLQLRLLASAYLAEGNLGAALEKAQAAISQVDAARDEDQVLFARQIRAQVLALQGDHEQALPEIQTVITELQRRGNSVNSVVVLRAQRIRAEILMRSGNAQAARDELQVLITKELSLTKGHSPELAQALDLLGCAEHFLGQGEASVLSHDRARTELEKIFPVNHPLLMRNTLYRLAASGDWSGFEHARSRVVLAPTSIWRRLIEAQLTPSSCNTFPSMCVFVLWS